jgi:GLPGLI family protein
MKLFLQLLLLFAYSQYAPAQAPLIIGDCTVIFSIKGSDAATNQNLTGASKTVYVKGKMSRVDMVGQNYKQSVIYDNKNGTAVVLKEIGTEKYMSVLSADDWKKENKRFEDLKLTLSNDSKTILGYSCKKAIANLKDGSSYSMYYATTIIPSAIENPYQFKDVPGFVLEYETSGSNNSSKITYTANVINFNPVPAYKFEIPTTGYRILK